MARKKIREYHGKKILVRNIQKVAGYDLSHLKSAQVSADTDLDKLPEEQPWLKEAKVVVKPDMLFGQRGKHGLVGLNLSWDEAKNFLRKQIGREVEVKGIKGQVTHFIVEKFVPHEQKEEYYVSFMTKREGNVINFTSLGGVEVEANWDKVKSVMVSVMEEDFDITNDIKGVVPEERLEATAKFINAAYKVFYAMDYSFMEFNPFCFNADGGAIPLDMRAELDDTAAFRHGADWGADLCFPEGFGRGSYPEEDKIHAMDEKTGASLKLTILNPKGRIWTMVAGGGASVIYTDTVADLGYWAELGNYGEYSGAPNTEETYQYAITIIDLLTRNPDAKNRAWILGGGIANFTDVAVTFRGIIQAIREKIDDLKKANVKIFCRRGGPNYQVGLSNLKKLGNELDIEIKVFGPESSMTCVVPMAIDWVKQTP